MRFPRRGVTVAAAVCLVGGTLGGCGIRLPHAQVVGAAGGRSAGNAGSVTAGGDAGSPSVSADPTGNPAPGEGTAAPPSGGGSAVTATGGGSGSGGPAGTTPAISPAPGAPNGPGGTTAASTAACGTGKLGPGVTAKTIKLGFMYVPDVSQANAGLGGSQWRAGEPDSDTAAFIKYFNSTGGICGRQIVAVPWDDHVVSGETQDTQDRAACTAWTQDNKVFAADVTADFLPIDTCMKAAGSVVVQVYNVAYHDSVDMATYPNVITPYAPTYDRFDPLFVNVMAANGYFTKGARVGLLYTNIPSEARSVQQTLIPALKAKGVNLVDSAEVQNTVDIDSLGQSESQTDEAVLRFQSEHIDHVLAPFDGFSLNTFATRAQQQGYAPVYATSTNAAGGDRGGLGQNVQFNGAVDLVWGSSLSWTEAQTNPPTRTCLQILQTEGVPPPEDQGGLDLAACDYLTFLRATLGRSPDLTEAGLLAAAQTVGVQPGDATWNWTLNPGRRDGIASYRVATYSGGASGQWRYTTPLAPLS